MPKTPDLGNYFLTKAYTRPKSPNTIDGEEIFSIKAFKGGSPRSPSSPRRISRCSTSTLILATIIINGLLALAYYEHSRFPTSPDIALTHGSRSMRAGIDISDMICSEEGALARELLQAGKRRLVKSDSWTRKTPREVGGAAKVCRNDWETNLAMLDTVFSAQSSIPKGADFTLAMYAHAGRLSYVEDQCKLWPGLPLVATIYAPLLGKSTISYPKNMMHPYKQLRELVYAAKKLHTRMTKAGHSTCSLRLEILTESLCNGAETATPINVLRNRALQLVQTQAVIFTDDEHLLNSMLAHTLTNPETAPGILAAAKENTGLLIPSLEGSDAWVVGNLRRQIATETASLPSKVSIKKLLDNGFQNDMPEELTPSMLGPFNWGKINAEERSKSIKKWKSLFGARCDHQAILGDSANPHYLAITAKVPYYDERIRSAHLSSTLQFRQMEQLNGNSTWTMLGDGWAVRLDTPHYEAGDKSTAERRRLIEELVSDELKNVGRGKYVPVVGVDEMCYNGPKPSYSSPV